MHNKLLRRGRGLSPEEQVIRKQMIQSDIIFLENLFGVVIVENEIISINI